MEGDPSEIDRLRRLLEAYKGLVEVSALINAITEYDELLPAILEVACRFIDAEAGSIFLVDDSGDLRISFVAGPTSGDVSSDGLVIPKGQGISGWVFEREEPLVIPDAYADPRFFRGIDAKTGFRTRSILCVPLRHRGRMVGVLQVLNPRSKGAFDEGDVEPFTAYANLVATAIEKLRALQRQREEERSARELQLARDIQQNFLPSELPKPDGVSFAAAYRPARNVGGDFYDVFEVAPGEIWFVLGDVAGKGVPAALLMARALAALRFSVRAGVSPAVSLARWNDSLAEDLFRGMFITAVLGRLDVVTREVEMAAAGHLPPACGGEFVAIEGGPPLGVLTGVEFGVSRRALEAGKPMLIYTDGLVESRRPDGEEFGEGRLTEALRGAADAAAAVAAAAGAEAAHRGTAESHDDLTLLAISAP
jgi:sigma-B regulation protein RsbU (phosphoserine phosphatase)